MKKALFFIIGLLLLSSCATLQPKEKTIATLPMVHGLRAIGGIRSVSLSWNIVQNPNIKGYIIYRGSSKSGPFKKIATIHDRFKTQYVDEGGPFEHLGDNTTYFYRISTFNNQGISIPSNVIAATTAPPPLPVVHITAASNLPRMVIVNWQPPSDKSITGYIIYMSMSNLGPFKEIGTNKGYLNTSFTVNNLKDGTTYYFSVASINYDGVKSNLVSYAQATTKFKPQPPRNLTANIVGAGALQLNWWPSITSDVMQYIIYRGTCSTCLVQIAKVKSSQLSYTDTDLQPGTTYWYRVNSVDIDGLESNTKGIKPFTTQPLPKPPLGISATELPNGSVLIQWNKAGKDVVAYKLYKEKIFLFYKELTETKETSYIDTNVKKGKTYTFWVRSIDKYGQVGPQSQHVSITIQ